MVTSVLNTATRKAKKKRDDLLGKPLMSKMTAPPISNKQQDKQQLDYNIKPVTEFKKDGTVSYSVGGKSFDLTKEEFKAMQGKGGQITPIVKAGQEASQEYSQAESIKRQLKQGADTLRITEQILAANRPKGQEQILPDISTLQAELKQGEQVSPTEPIAATAEFLTKPRAVQAGLKTAATVGATIENFVNIPFINLGSKKTEQVQMAEKGFNQYKDSIKAQTELVKIGQLDAGSVVRNIRNALEQINKLEAQTKGLGKVNLRYWLDEGAEIEAISINERQELQNLLVELEAAQQANLLNQARVTYGQ